MFERDEKHSVNANRKSDSRSRGSFGEQKGGQGEQQQKAHSFTLSRPAGPAGHGEDLRGSRESIHTPVER